MRFWLKGVTAALAIALSGCTWLQRDRTINLACPALERHMQEIRFDLQVDGSLASVIGAGAGAQNEIMRSGNAEIGAAAVPANDDRLSQAMTRAVDRWGASMMVENDDGAPPPLPAVLLLSGGGQWGAFGAGYLRSLSRNGDAAIRHSAIVTGISTGAIQTLFVLADDYDGLYDAYTAHEAEEYARVYSGTQSLINGSRYSIGPLLGLLRARLMGSDGKASLLGTIAHRLHHRTADMRGPREAFVGMVNARSGHFVQVDLSGLIRDIVPSGEQPTAEDADCVAAVVLASSAIPVNFERIAISYGAQGSTRRDVFYDGGVRQSVFFNHVASRSIAQMERFKSNILGANERETEEMRQTVPDSLPFFVIRNGSSTVSELATVNGEHDILTAAERGYAIIVNQSEVMAVCALRLGNPRGQIKVQTADSFRTPQGLQERPPPGSAFDTHFMRRLAAHGEAVGNGAHGQPRWLVLQPTLGGPPNRGCALQ
ncbi:MAG: patatin-like phospholipase family protein [Sphingopyxis sp.]